MLIAPQAAVATPITVDPATTAVVNLLHFNDFHGRTRARLLDLVPGRSGGAYRSWLHDRGPAFRDRVEIATLDPFHGYKNAIDDQLEDARAVLDAFHVVKLATKVVDGVLVAVERVERRDLDPVSELGPAIVQPGTVRLAGAARDLSLIHI